MSIEMSAAGLRELAAALHAVASDAEDIAPRLDRAGDVGPALLPAVEAFLEAHRAAGRALAGELGWLGATVEAAADSWLDLDRGLLASHGRARAE
ncbi:UNVERIFIED_ORG: hypothetical protein E4P37_10145 [Bacillus sp. AZ43]